MRRRIGIAAMTGLGGNPAPSLMDGKLTPDPKLNRLIKKCAKEAHDLFFTSFGYCDAQYTPDEISLGIEPSYMYDPLKIITINKHKDMSLFVTGRAVGPWASAIISKQRGYGDYKCVSKFVRFIDKWHPIFFPQMKMPL